MFPDDHFYELAQALIDSRLDSGSAREVFALRGLPFVAKVERGQTFQNVMEWSLWQDSEGTPLQQWLAPCHSISNNGAVLIQARTMPLVGVELPERVPAALTDLKVQNFGLFEDRVVCHDYGLHLAGVMGAGSRKTKSARWWDGSSGRYIDASAAEVSRD